MQETIFIRGIVESPPVICQHRLEFRVRSGSSRYYIIRLDPAWQKRDILFLDTGQVVEVHGIPSGTDPAGILATTVRICSPPIQRLLRSRADDKER